MNSHNGNNLVAALIKCMSTRKLLFILILNCFNMRNLLSVNHTMNLLLPYNIWLSFVVETLSFVVET